MALSLVRVLALMLFHWRSSYSCYYAVWLRRRSAALGVFLVILLFRIDLQSFGRFMVNHLSSVCFGPVISVSITTSYVYYKLLNPFQTWILCRDLPGQHCFSQNWSFHCVLRVLGLCGTCDFAWLFVQHLSNLSPTSILFCWFPMFGWPNS